MKNNFLVNFILLHGYSLDNSSLMFGKMGYSLILFEYSHYFKDALAEKHAFELLQEVLASPMKSNTFNEGKMGIAWSLIHLIEKEYIEADYLPVSKKDIGAMYQELLGFVRSVKNPYLSKLLNSFFAEDEAFAKAFQFHSAAKTVHHGFVGGLLEHTLSVTKLCNYYAGYYPQLNRDLLLTAAMFHDIGKTQELSRFPENDYTDDGQLLGHIIIGTEMVGERIRRIDGFPAGLATELKHCILAHHGELEYGSPKKPALLEALALNFADNTDAKMETMIEALQAGGENKGWLGYNRLLETNIRRTTE